MAQLFEQYLVLTDLDGTVVDEALNILPRDIEAISYFIANGGTFGVSTGRVMVSAMPLVRRLPTNAPCVFLNGGAIMDPHTGVFLHRSYLDESGREALRQITGHFPDLRAAVLMGDDFYNVTEFGDGKTPFDMDVPQTIAADLDTMPGGWYKVLMNIMDYSMDEVDAFCRSLDYPRLKFIRSTVNYYEVMPAENSKARGNRLLAQLKSWQDKTLVVIGDYFNDLEMIRDADLGVTVEAAPQLVKDAADLVVCDVHQGAVCQLVQRLEAMSRGR